MKKRTAWLVGVLVLVCALALLRWAAEDRDVAPDDDLVSEGGDPVLRGSPPVKAEEPPPAQTPPAEDPGDPILPLTPHADLRFGIRMRVFMAPWMKALPPNGPRLALSMNLVEPVLLAPIQSLPFSEQVRVPDAEGLCTFGPMKLPLIPRRFAENAWITLNVRGGSHEERYHLLNHRKLQSIIEEEIAKNGLPGDGVVWWDSNLFLKLYLTARGSVATADGMPIEGAEVRWLAPSKLRSRSQTVTREGTFELGLFGLEPEHGEVQLEVRLRNVDREPLVRTFSQAELGAPQRIIVQDVSWVAGRVTLPDGSPLPRAEVVLADTPQAFAQRRNSFYRTGDPALRRDLRATSQDDGRFMVPGVRPGVRYWVFWRRDDGTMASLDRTVEAGERDVHVVIDRHRLRVRVRDAVTRRQIPCRVELLTQDGKRMSPERPVLESALEVKRAQGRLMEDGFVVSAGMTLVFRVTARGYDDARVTHVVRNAPGVDELIVDMSPSTTVGSLRVRIEDVDGEIASLPRGLLERVLLEPAARGDEVVSRSSILTTRRPVPGGLLLGEIPSGRYVVRVLGVGSPRPKRLHRYWVDSQTVDVVAGEEVTQVLVLRDAGAVRIELDESIDVSRAGTLVSLVDSHGVAVPNLKWLQDGNHLSGTPNMVSLRRGVRGALSGAVLPGAYTLRVFLVGDNRREAPIEEPVQVEAGHTVHVSVGAP